MLEDWGSISFFSAALTSLEKTVHVGADRGLVSYTRGPDAMHCIAQ